MSNSERIAIYIDRKNFNKNYSKRGYRVSEDGFVPFDVWQSLNSNIIKIYDEKSNSDGKNSPHIDHHVHHLGTWLFVSERTDFLSMEIIDPKALAKEKKFLKFMKSVDSLYGYNIKYGTRISDGKNERIKGVDINIVCHMMHNAFQDHYDVAILVTDNEEFVPVVEMVQDEFGKQVYHMGFAEDRLRATCFGNIPIEQPDYNKWLPKKEDKK